MSNPDYSIVESRGSSIDPEASGPFPPNRDERQRDVFQDQDDRLDGRRSASEPITDDFNPPEAFEVSPPPPMPSLAFEQPQDIAELAAEAARAAINDALRNMTINGVSPDMSGGSVSFDVPTEPSASTAFAAMNTEPNITPPLPSTPAIVEMPPMEAPAVPSVPDTVDPASVPPTEAIVPEPTEAPAPEATPTTPPEVDTGEGARQEGAQPEPPEPPDTQSQEPPQVEEATPAADEEEGGDQKESKGALTERQRGEMRGEYEERIKNLKEVMKDEDAAQAIAAGDLSYLNSGYVPVLFTRKDGQRKILVQIDNSFAAVIEGAVSGERVTSLPSESAYYLAGGGEEGSFHPFQIRKQLVPESDPPVYEVKVESASKIYSGFGSFAETSIVGLDVWTEASVGYVIIEAQVSAEGVVTSQVILWGEASLGDRITFSEETQTAYRFPIAYLYFEESSLKIRQLSFTDKTLVTICVDGKNAIYPI